MPKVCYAARLNDCDGDIEGEHFVSEAALRTLRDDNRLEVRGFPVLNGRQAVWSIATMKARVLCSKHNRFLSTAIDVAGANLMKALADAEIGVPGTHELDGDHLERWLVKTLCGGIAAGHAANATGRVMAHEQIRIEWLRHVFGQGAPLLTGYGLWVEVPKRGSRFSSHGEIAFGPLMNDDQTQVTGGLYLLRNIRFLFVGIKTGPEGSERPAGHRLKNALYRPQSLCFRAPTGETRVRIQWPDEAGGEIRFATRPPTKNGPRAKVPR